MELCMSHNIVPGATVRGPFTVKNVVKNRMENLVDKHMVVLAVSRGQAVCAYTGTNADAAFKAKTGYVEVPQHANVAAGWKASGNFFCDASSICLVPVEKLEVLGKVSSKFLATVIGRVQSLGTRVERTTYAAQADERVTGYARQLKTHGSLR
jgi:hypothetical protein